VCWKRARTGRTADECPSPPEPPERWASRASCHNLHQSGEGYAPIQAQLRGLRPELAAGRAGRGSAAMSCTFCAEYVENILHNVCPNCAGGFVARPIRPSSPLRGVRRFAVHPSPTVSPRARPSAASPLSHARNGQAGEGRGEGPFWARPYSARAMRSASSFMILFAVCSIGRLVTSITGQRLRANSLRASRTSVCTASSAA